MIAPAKFASKLVLAFSVLGVLAATPAIAQDKPSVEDARKTLESWNKIQDPIYDAKTKEVVANPIVVQKILLNDNNQQVASLGIQIDEEKKESKLVIEVPIGARLDSGLAIRLDEEKPITLPYRVCFPTSCFAEMTVTEDFIAKMKAGNMLGVLVRPFPAGDIVGLPFSLQGFTASYDGAVVPVEKLLAARQSIDESLRAQQNKDVQGLAEKRRQELEQKQKQ